MMLKLYFKPSDLIYCTNNFTITVSKLRVHLNLARHSFVSTAFFHIKSKHKLPSNNIKPLFLIKNIKIDSGFYSYKHLLSGTNSVEKFNELSRKRIGTYI